MTILQEGETVVQSHRPSLGEKLFFLASGIVVSIPIAFFFEPSIAFLRQFFPNLQGFQAEILLVVVLAPMIEEFAKAYPLFYRHGESQRVLSRSGVSCRSRFRNHRVLRIRGVAECFAFDKVARNLFPCSDHFNHSLWRCNEAFWTVVFDRIRSSFLAQLCINI